MKSKLSKRSKKISRKSRKNFRKSKKSKRNYKKSRKNLKKSNRKSRKNFRKSKKAGFLKCIEGNTFIKKNKFDLNDIEIIPEGNNIESLKLKHKNSNTIFSHSVKLGEGNFGAVYLFKENSEGHELILKEFFIDDSFNAEAAIYNDLGEEQKNLFPSASILDKYKYILMERLGEPLVDYDENDFPKENSYLLRKINIMEWNEFSVFCMDLVIALLKNMRLLLNNNIPLTYTDLKHDNIMISCYEKNAPMELKFIDLGGLTKIGGAPTYPGGIHEHPFFKKNFWASTLDYSNKLRMVINSWIFVLFYIYEDIISTYIRMKQKEIPQDISSLLCPIVEGQYKCEQQAPGFSLDSGAVSVVSEESNHILLNFIKEFYKQINELYEKLKLSIDEIKKFEQNHLAEYFCKLIDSLDKIRNTEWEKIKNESTNIFPENYRKKKKKIENFLSTPTRYCPQMETESQSSNDNSATRYCPQMETKSQSSNVNSATRYCSQLETESQSNNDNSATEIKLTHNRWY